MNNIFCIKKNESQGGARLSGKRLTTSLLTSLFVLTNASGYSSTGLRSIDFSTRGTAFKSAFWPLQTEYVINAVITDEDGKALGDVSVSEKGTNNRTKTDKDGRFMLKVKSKDAVIIVSAVGYSSTEVQASQFSAGQFALKIEDKELEEVVVTAYGRVKKSNLTDAVQTISGEALANRPIRTVTDGLIGLAPGVNIRMTSGAPESGPSLNIRGFTSINSMSAPLVLVDGMERPIQDVNPNDVESISFLKDGAASAMYGSRAPYGVVLITTKSGKLGSAMVSYSGNVKIGKMVLAPTQPDSPDWARFINMAQRNGQPNGSGSDGVDALTIARMEAWLKKDWNNPAFDDLRSQFGDMAQMYIENGQFPTNDAGFKNWTREQSFATTKLYDSYFNNADVSQQHNLNFSGGTEKVRYLSSFGYNNTKGLLKGDINYNRRYSFQTKLDYNATDWLSFRTNVNYVNWGNQGPNYYGAGGTAANYGTIFSSMMQYFATPLRVPSGNAYSWILGAAGIMGEGGLIKNTRTETILSGGTTITPFKNFEISADYSRSQRNTTNSTVNKIVYTELPNGTKIQNNRSANVNSISKTSGLLAYQFAKMHLQYKNTFAEKHNLFVQVGAQMEDTDYESLTGSRTDLYAPNTIEAISAAANNPLASDDLYNWSTLGYYGVLTYDYQEKYMLKVSGRRDASSRFSPDSRWGFFPSVSGAWNIAKENFWPAKDYVSSFKPRVSWSTSGDLASVGASNYYTYLPTLGINVNKTTLLGGGYTNVATAPGLVSSELTWAKPTVLNLGVDISALNNRLDLTYEWYQRTIIDQMGPPDPLPQVLGTTAPQVNNSVSQTRGWELSIGWNDRFQLAQKTFNYGLKFNMSDYIGYVTEYYANKTGLTSGVWTPGEVFGQNFVYDFARIAQNTQDLNKGTLSGTYNYPGYIMYNDINGDGYINSGNGGYWYSRGDLVADGFNYPRRSYSILPSFSWGDIGVSAVLDGVMHWRVYNSSEWVWGTRAGGDLAYFYTPAFKESTDLGYWSPDNTDAFFPAFNTGRGTATNKYSLNLANLRVRNITVSYNLPKNWLQKAKINKATVYFSGENLGFIYNKSFIKYDPELLSSGVNGYPPLRYYSFGVNLSL